MAWKRNETRRKLDKILNADRIRILLAVSFAAVALGSAIYLSAGLNTSTVVGQVTATVTSSRHEPDGDSGRWVTNFEAKMPDGRTVRVSSSHPSPPNPGDSVTLNVRKDGLGLNYYEWKIDDNAR